MKRYPFLEKLIALLDDTRNDAVFPCINDLVANGLQVSRFTPSDNIPNRQDVTQYLAAWCKDACLSEDVARTWLCDYAVSMLAPLSKSSLSAIRHSTKSNVKYCYASGNPFVCERENNKFRANCSKTCPVYDEMVTRAAQAKAEALAAMERRHAVVSTKNVTDAVLSVKETHRDQFLLAMQLVSRELAKGTKYSSIVDLLKQQGMKSRTGREWTYGILNFEIQKLRQTQRAELTTPELVAPRKLN